MNDIKTHNTSNTEMMENTNSVVDFAMVHKERIFSDETLQSLNDLGRVLGKIRRRLVDEGYTIKDGKCFKEKAKNDMINTQEDVYEKCS